MGKKKKTGKNRLDKFYHLAKDQGYRSRAAFKLIQLNKKFNFLGKANVLVDLCAAPGSWLQVASKFMPAERTLIGVDLDAIKGIPNCTTFVEDITTQKCRTEIKKCLNGKMVDVVLHDGAPNMGSGWIQDAYTQSELVLSALKLASEFLVKDGVFISKVFRSADYNSLLWVFHQLFKKVTSTKPTASRSVSAEIFVVCEGYHCPKKLDPRLLDSRFIFKELDQPSKQINLFAKKKAKPNQQGYGDDTGPGLFKKCSVVHFLTTEDPIPILAEYNQISFTPAADGEDPQELKLYEQHPKTTVEVKACLGDLKVLNAKDFRLLLKWRLQMRSFRSAAKKARKGTAEGEADSEDDSSDEEEGEDGEKKKKKKDEEEEKKEETPEERRKKLQEEIEDHVKATNKEKKKKEKKKRRDLQKVKLRLGLMGNNVDLGVDFEAPTEAGLFNLKTVGNGALKQLVKAETDQEAAPEVTDTDMNDDDFMDEHFDVVENRLKPKEPRMAPINDDIGDEDEGDGSGPVKHDKTMERYLDLLYDDYVYANQEYRKKLSKKLRREKSQREEIPEDLADFSKYVATKKKDLDGIGEDEDNNDEAYANEYDGEDQELLVAPKSNVTLSKKTSMWFNQDLFEDVEEEEKEEKEEKEEEEETLGGGIKRKRDATGTDRPLKKKKLANGEAAEASQEAEESEYDQGLGEVSDGEFEETEGEATEDDAEGNKKNTMFEEVKVEDLLDEEEERLFSNMDETERAQILAMGELLKDPTMRAAILDKTVNRFSHDDGDQELPRWFVENEEEHSRPQQPVTKEQVTLYREKMKAIDSRSIKKVAEATARKKKKFQLKLDKARTKARSIAATADMSEHEKIKQIQKLYKGQLGKVKPTRVYVVARKLSSAKLPATNVKIKLVDPRLKKDKRGRDASTSRKNDRRKKHRK